MSFLTGTQAVVTLPTGTGSTSANVPCGDGSGKVGIGLLGFRNASGHTITGLSLSSAGAMSLAGTVAINSQAYLAAYVIALGDGDAGTQELTINAASGAGTQSALLGWIVLDGRAQENFLSGYQTTGGSSEATGGLNISSAELHDVIFAMLGRTPPGTTGTMSGGNERVEAANSDVTLVAGEGEGDDTVAMSVTLDSGFTNGWSALGFSVAPAEGGSSGGEQQAEPGEVAGTSATEAVLGAIRSAAIGVAAAATVAASVFAIRSCGTAEAHGQSAVEAARTQTLTLPVATMRIAAGGGLEALTFSAETHGQSAVSASAQRLGSSQASVAGAAATEAVAHAIRSFEAQAAGASAAEAAADSVGTQEGAAQAAGSSGVAAGLAAIRLAAAGAAGTSAVSAGVFRFSLTEGRADVGGASDVTVQVGALRRAVAWAHGGSAVQCELAPGERNARATVVAAALATASLNRIRAQVTDGGYAAEHAVALAMLREAGGG